MNTVNELNESKSTRHIVVTEATYRKIKALGKMGQTFDEVINQLLSEGRQKEIDNAFGEVSTY